MLTSRTGGLGHTAPPDKKGGTEIWMLPENKQQGGGQGSEGNRDGGSRQ